MAVKRTHKQAGDAGELEVIALVPCPNCGKKLMNLPPSYPLYDVQCTDCSFRAQVKTNMSKPKSVIFGAGWDIMEKVLKSGFITPPLIANFKWEDKIGKHQLSPTARRANYWMFNYVDLHKLPFLTLYPKSKK